MKVIIANPPWETEAGYGIRTNSRWPHVRPDKHLQFPIFLAYTSALLKAHGHEVKCIDAVAAELDSRAFVEEIVDFGPEMVFLESSTPSFDQDIANARAVKRRGCPVYLFGTHVTSFVKEIVQEYRDLDGFISGEFETIIRDLASGQPKGDVLGLAYWDEASQAARINPRAPNIENLDDLPFPDREAFDPAHYYIHLDPKPNALLVASRGCPFQCTYCIWPQQMNGHQHRMRSAKNIVDEIEALIAEQKIIFFRFDDDIFSLVPKKVIEFCDEMIQRGINKKVRWTCFGHVNVNHEEMYRKMAQAGCRRIDFGVESGSEKILKIMKKNIDIGKAKQTFDLCRKHGIRTYADYMLGFPQETEEDIWKTIDSALYIDPDYIQISYCVPIPGTSMYFDGINDGSIDRSIPFDKYDATGQIVNTGDISAQRLKELYNTFWKRFYLRPKLVGRELRRALKSKNEFVRVMRGSASFYKRVLGPNKL